jgi:hypothetical protein
MKHWQYNGQAPFNEICNWCDQNIKDQFQSDNFETIYFKNEKAYCWFLLRWT